MPLPLAVVDNSAPSMVVGCVSLLLKYRNTTRCSNRRTAPSDRTLQIYSSRTILARQHEHRSPPDISGNVYHFREFKGRI